MANKKIINKFFESLYRQAYYLNTDNIVCALKKTGPHSHLLDVGCWDGEQTKTWIEAAGAKKTSGIEPISSVIKSARKNGINAVACKADAGKWPFKNSTFDCIVSNQVVEHLSDVDSFLSESSRTLKKGGYLITSTNNLSSLHNIFALLLGWAPFDLSNSSRKVMGIGNPLAVHKNSSDDRGGSWTHKCIYTKKWLFDWQSQYGLEPYMSFGSGLYPLPAYLGKYIQKYCAFMTLVSIKR